MSFCVLDDKGECFGYYTNGNLVFDGELPDECDRTWKYLPFLPENVEYARLYCHGAPLDEVCPESMEKEWFALTEKMRAFIRSFQIAKIDLNQVCFYDLVPEQFLYEFFDAKSRIIDSVFKEYQKPEDYDFQLDLEKLLLDIGQRELILDKSALNKKLHQSRARNFLKKIDKSKNVISYNQYGSKTGRLTTNNGTFPILTMDKMYRSIVKPKNGWFVEMDYNAAELRTLIGLSGKQQPDIDVHEWNSKQIGKDSREEVKKDFFAWLYGSTHVDGTVFEKLYETGEVKSKYWDGKEVKNIFGRKIVADEHHALNYIIQSTTADLVLRQAIKANKVLQNCNSYIAMIIHDSIVIDLDYSEREKIVELKKVFSENRFGTFKTNIRIGKDLGNMKEVEI